MTSYKIKWDTLEPFGFVKNGKQYVYKESFLNHQFEVVITIDENGQLKSYIWDCEMNNEYTNHQLISMTGTFVSTIRANYQAILDKVLQNCLILMPFKSAQGNRLAQLINEQWGELPDFPFKHLKQTGVFRYPVTQKWYALLIQIPKNKLINQIDEEIVEVINVKVGKDKLQDHLKNPNIFPAYHMSKKSWVSILLDDALEDATVFRYIQESRNRVIKN